MKFKKPSEIKVGVVGYGGAFNMGRAHLNEMKRAGMTPVAVAELVPAYLPAVPADWMGGQPLHYERTDNGWFRLWSIGDNGKDDGGVFRKTTSDGSNLGDDLDWPWPLPLPTRDARLF